ncbi:MAG: NAD(P)/FAD-dependent oxidoreductase [Actinomycetota bacterium]
MAHRVLILGGGFGGIAAAVRLRELLDPADEIVLVDRRTHFFMGFRKTMAVIGREPLSDGSRPIASLASKGIRVAQTDVTRIDPAARAAEFDGDRFEADALIVALGADVVPDAVPGLSEHGHNVYSADGVDGAAQGLATIERGRVVVGIFGAPYKCSPAPYELALLGKEATDARGAKTEWTVFTPQPMSIPVIGKGGCEAIEGRLAGNWIDFRPNTKAERVETGRVVLAAGGGDIPFDLLLAVPPHRVPVVVTEAGLAEKGGWVKVNPRTLETSFEGVSAVGDVTGFPTASGQPFPKAGVFAEREGLVVAERIAARFAGREPDTTFDGEGFCFLEAGNGEAMLVRGNFLAEPAPDVELTPPSREFYEQKTTFEREHLDAWFGPA